MRIYKNRHEWAKHATAADQRLNDAVTHYENEYFEDMRFLPGSIAGDVLVSNVNHVMKKKRNKEYWADPFNISLDNYIFRVKEMKDKRNEGVFFINKNMIDLCPATAESPCLILHEMVHVYDYILDIVWSDYSLKEILLLRLYDKLRDKIKNLDRLSMTHAHYENQYSNIMDKCGCHGILFFLKCLDLDLRLGVHFGETYGYKGIPQK